MANNVEYNIKVNSGQAVVGAQKVEDSLKKVSTGADKAKQQSTQFTESLKQGVQNIPGPIGDAARGFASVNKAIRTATVSTRAFGMALAATGIGAIALALGALVKAFFSTQEGADTLSRVMEPLKAIVETVWGAVQDLSTALAGTLTNAFNNPKQAIIDLAQNVIQNLFINRLNGIIEATGAVGRALMSLARLDFSGASDELGNIASATLQTVTGFENLEGRAEAVGQEVANAFRAGSEAGSRIAELNIEIEETQNAQIISLARINAEKEESLRLSRDQTLSDEERLEAGRRANDLLQQERDEKRQLLELEIERKQIAVSLNDTDREAQAELNRLLAQRDELEANFQRQQRRTVGTISRIEQEQVEANKSAAAALEERAEAFRQMLLSEEELQQQKFESDLQLLRETLEAEAITQEEYNQIKLELEREQEVRLREMRGEQRRIEEGSIAATEARISALQDEFRNAATQAERVAINERIKLAEKELESRKNVEEVTRKESEKTAKARIKATAEALGESLAANAIEQRSFRAAAREIIGTVLDKIYVKVFESVIQKLPFPFNVILAPIAASAAKQLAGSAIPGYATGGLVTSDAGQRIQRNNGDNRLVTVRTGEAILNQRQQDIIGRGNLAAAGVPGFRGMPSQQRVSVDTEALENTVAEMRAVLQDINVRIDLVETTRRINEQNRRFTEREIEL